MLLGSLRPCEKNWVAKVFLSKSMYVPASGAGAVGLRKVLEQRENVSRGKLGAGKEETECVDMSWICILRDFRRVQNEQEIW